MPRRAIRILIVALLAAALAVTALWWMGRPVAVPPDAPLADAGPGTLVAVSRFEHPIAGAAETFRLHYVTRRFDGSLSPATALLILPPAPAPAEGRPLVAWAHGTTGVAPGCAPSLTAEPLRNVPAATLALAEGWAIVAPDYPGLGTRAPPFGHAYLVGPDAGRAMLDAVRAARALTAARLSDATIVWGHSQGGHAALWTAIEQPGHAPDVALSGVAALAPATDLAALADHAPANAFGRIVLAYLASAWSAAYPDLATAPVWAPPPGRTLARDIARRCVLGYEALLSVAAATLIPGQDPLAPEARRGPLARYLAANTPSGLLPTPVLLAQGMADDLVLPAIQDRWVASRCAKGDVTMRYIRYEGLGHLSLVAPASPLEADLMAWSRERLAGAPTADGCERPS